jgi:23S rRNA (cytidine1920-2'-O)/16S rRNA (cytidine1409-2'-O)-methyltransferase
VPRRRLDAELVRRGLASTREEAQDAVRAGLVTVGGVTAQRPATLVAADAAVRVLEPARGYVSRGGGKLEAALDRFDLDPAGSRCLDAGASTGGFTDCLLQRGASAVIAVDVGYGQLSWSLRNDPRVMLLERTNVRNLTRDDLPFAPELVVADLSFISLRHVLPALAGLADPAAGYVVLVKPQFEARTAEVADGGVIRDPDVWERVLAEVSGAAGELGLGTVQAMASPLPGPAGNIEFLLELRRGAATTADLPGAIAEARGLAP